MVRKKVVRFIALFMSAGMLVTSIPVNAAELETYSVEEQEDESAQQVEEDNSEENEESEEGEKNQEEVKKDEENKEPGTSENDEENQEKEPDEEENKEKDSEQEEELIEDTEISSVSENEISSISENEISVLSASDDFIWSGKTITGYTGSESNVVISAEALEIGNRAFENNTTITTIEFEQGSQLRKIGEKAFYGCTGLINAIIPENVTEIGKGAFSRCSNLSTVDIRSNKNISCGYDSSEGILGGCQISTVKFPEGIKTIPANLFIKAGFASGTKIAIPSSVAEIGSCAFAWAQNLVAIDLENCTELTVIGEGSFRSIEIESIVIPENVTKIGNEAFKGCTNLFLVDIRSTKDISCNYDSGTGIFCNCQISTVKFPEGMKKIPGSLFMNAGFVSGTEIKIPASVAEIESYAFAWTGNLVRVKFASNDTLLTIGKGAFRGTGLLEVSIPESVQTIGESAFYGTAIESVVLPKSVLMLNKEAFSNCSQLTSVTIESKNMKCEYDVYGIFGGCQINTVKFPEGIKTIPANLFLNANFATGTELTIPMGVSTIERYAFGRCKGLKSIYIPSSVTQIDSDAFYRVTDLEVHCVSGSVAEKWAKSKGYTIVASYGIAYNLNGGENNESNPVSYKIGDTLTLYPASRKGYTFTGWYADKAYKNQIVGENGGRYTPDIKAGNLTLYAKWTINSYNITYDYNGGQAPNKANPSIYDVSKDYPLNVPTRAGYAFTGWKVNDTENVLATNKITKGTYAEDLRLTAQWREYSYTVKYNKNAKDAVGTMEDMQGVSYFQEYTLPEEQFTRMGYDFTGWNTLANGKGTAYQPGYKVSGLTGKDKATVILYAQWQQRPYEILYVLNGGTNHAKNPGSYPMNTTVRLQNPTKEGYTFAGWYTDSQFTNKITTVTKTQGDVTVYAKWTENSYTIRYEKNQGVCPKGKSMNPEKVSYTEEKILAGNVFERTGYVFRGWNTKANGKGTAYGDGETVSKLSVKNNSTVTLYAQWEVVDLVITYELGGGENAAANPAVVNITKDVKLKKPSREGYTFAGWYADETFQNKVTVISKKTTTPVTVYAKWTENSYTLKFDKNSGTVELPGQASYHYTDEVTMPEGTGAVRNQYTLTGWNTKRDRSGIHYEAGQVYSGLVQKGTLTLYAEWTPDQDKTYQISYQNLQEGDTNTNPASYSFEKDVKLAAPVREGYTFNGWYTDDSYTTKVTVIKKSEKGNRVLHAKWTENTYTVKFNGNKGSLPKKVRMNAVTTGYTQQAKLTENVFVRSGYTFNGWNSKANGSGNSYTDGQMVERLLSKNKGTVTLYAQWKPVVYSITYKGIEAGDTNGNPDSYTVEKDVKLENPVRQGYTFKGWYASDAYTKKVTTISRNTKAAVTVYAKWKENSYTVRFSLRGGEGSMKSLANRGYTQKIALPDTIPVREGKTFAGWALNGEETAQYQPGEEISFADLYAAGGMDKGVLNRYFTLYAVWE